MRVMSIKIDDELVRLLDRYASDIGRSRSDAIRKILKEKMKEVYSQSQAKVVACAPVESSKRYECKYCHMRYISHTGITDHLMREHSIQKPFSPHFIRVDVDE